MEFGFGIETRYHGPTNTKGARISARLTDDRGMGPVFVDYEYELTGVAAHKPAAEKLLDRWVATYPYPAAWSIVAVASSDRGYIFVAKTREAEGVSNEA